MAIMELEGKKIYYSEIYAYPQFQKSKKIIIVSIKIKNISFY